MLCSLELMFAIMCTNIPMLRPWYRKWTGGVSGFKKNQHAGHHVHVPKEPSGGRSPFDTFEMVSTNVSLVAALSHLVGTWSVSCYLTMTSKYQTGHDAHVNAQDTHGLTDDDSSEKMLTRTESGIKVHTDWIVTVSRTDGRD